ncbi:hypothetical protein [Streptomyces sp. LN245]|uniref:hypothetical protein n=1 Tax=Streptomyces sp. LN245 TaxID=3112975 RepID=UPI0037206B90
MTTEVTSYTMAGRNGEKYEIPDAIPAAPGLVVFRLPHGLSLNNPCRWNIGHHSGRCVAEAMRREDALKAVEVMAGLYDWTKDTAFLREEVDERQLFLKLSRMDCGPVGSEYMRGDVSHNGTYTDADIEAAAAEFKDDGFNALDVLIAMSNRVPWMGLDTDDFNEAHNRVATLADAD